jgi:hypothetical protein
VITGIVSIPQPNPDGTPQNVPVNGALFKPIRDWTSGDYRVILKSDFVRDWDSVKKQPRNKAVDGDHLPPWVPQAKSGDQIQGGTFESWFSIRGL